MLLLCIKFQGRFFSAFDFPNFAIERVGASFFFFPFFSSCFLINFGKVKSVPLSGSEIIFSPYRIICLLFYMHLCLGICYSKSC